MEANRTYESTYIVTPDLAPSDYSAIVEKFNKLLADNGAKIIHQEIWGLKKLAYEINRKQSGYYVYTEFQSANQNIVAKLEQEYIYDERLIRYLTIKLEKHSLEYAQKRKAKLAGELTKKTTQN